MYLQYNAVFRLLQVSLRVCTAIAFWCFLSTEVSSQPRVLRLIPYCLLRTWFKACQIHSRKVFCSVLKLIIRPSILVSFGEGKGFAVGLGHWHWRSLFQFTLFQYQRIRCTNRSTGSFLKYSISNSLQCLCSPGFEVTSCDTGSKRCLFVGRPSGIFVDRSLNSKTWLFAESCNQNKAIVCSLRIQLLFSANDSGKDGKGSRVGQTIIPIHRIHLTAITINNLDSTSVDFFLGHPLPYRSYAYTTIIRHDTAYTNNMIPVCIYSYNVFTCLFCIPCDHSMHASRPGTLSADELRKQSEMAKMVPCP